MKTWLLLVIGALIIGADILFVPDGSPLAGPLGCLGFCMMGMYPFVLHYKTIRQKRAQECTE